MLRVMASVAEIFDSMAWGPAPEAAEPALAWLDQHERRFGHFVAGAWRPAAATFEITNPANRQVLGSVGQVKNIWLVHA
jgi:aldehyde dehydrogenase (NAD+)